MSGDTLSQMVDQTVSVNTLHAEGAPDTDWAEQGRLWAGNDPGVRTHINPWFVVFRTDGNPPPSDAAVEVGDLSLYILYSGVWQRVTYHPRIQGQMYIASFEGWDTGTTPTTPANFYSSPNAFAIVDNNIEDWCFHGYLPRTAITGTIQGIIVAVEARLISKTGLDASSYAETMLMQIGCDYKASDGSNVRDAFTGSMTPLTEDFQRFYGTTLTKMQLKANPPPVALEQFP